MKQKKKIKKVDNLTNSICFRKDVNNLENILCCTLFIEAFKSLLLKKWNDVVSIKWVLFNILKISFKNKRAFSIPARVKAFYEGFVAK